MIRFQIVERPNAHLFNALCEAMSGGSLQTFSLQKRRRKVVHTAYPGWMNWSNKSGVILCEVISPAKPGYEWQFFHSFIGRLANRFPDLIHGISVQFAPPEEEPAPRPRKRKSAKTARSRKRASRTRR